MPSPPLDTNTHPRVHSPGPGPINLRHRGMARSVTYAEGSTRFQTQRRNSTLSDTVSEARNSIRSSTDDLFFPRVAKRDDANLSEESHWQSAPLGLALLPAIAGVFFQNGSAVVTDVTLLVLAAIFLNWSVRLPWDWYRSAQAVRLHDKYDATEINFDVDDSQNQARSSENANEVESKRDAASAASRELQIHELVALTSCFVFPIIGTWILHTIRCKLSRPSEGLVSNYNLTIFLLAAEIRPFSHLLKLVQARTLYLQRIVALSCEEEKDKIDASKITDLMKRLEELEAHVAETAAARISEKDASSPEDQSPAQNQDLVKSVVAQATADARKVFQPEIDALNRAVRRYEKRTTITTVQTESRLHDLEMHVQDAIALAAAAQRSSAQHRSFLYVLWGWAYTLACLPAQVFMSLAALPVHAVRRCLQCCKSFLKKQSPSQKHNKGKSAQDRQSHSPRRSRRGSQNSTADPKALKPIREHR